MALRIGMLVWGAVGTAGLFLWATGGQIDAADGLNLLAGLVVLAALWIVVKLPWDLYFAARGVQLAQQESTERQLPVSADEKAEAQRLVKRLLAVCIALHLTGASVSLVGAWLSDGRIGGFAAVAFLLTMGLRPGAAMVGHVRRRLMELNQRALIPREDARDLQVRLRKLEKKHAALARVIADEHTGLVAVNTATESLAASTDSRLRIQEQRFKADMDRVCVEFERSIEKLTSDQEILSGIRAFLTLVRQTG